MQPDHDDGRHGKRHPQAPQASDEARVISGYGLEAAPSEEPQDLVLALAARASAGSHLDEPGPDVVANLYR